jgi:hypothetical protein
MIESTLDTAQSILTIHPESALTEADFASLAAKVDPYIESHGALHGLVIDAPRFPGWDSFGALAAHIRFVRDHHRRVEKIAIVTDSAVGGVVQHLASHFVAATIRHFPSAQRDAARQWVASRS